MLMTTCYWNVTGYIMEHWEEERILDHLDRCGLTADDVWTGLADPDNGLEVSLRLEARTNTRARKLFYELLEEWSPLDVSVEPD